MSFLLGLLLLQAAALNVTGNVEATGTVKAEAFLLPDGTPLAGANQTRVLTYVAGCGSCEAIRDSDDEPDIFLNLYGSPLTILEVHCSSDGDVSINLQRKGSTANILATDLQCTPDGARTTTFIQGENVLNPEGWLNYLTASVRHAHRVTVSIRARLN